MISTVNVVIYLAGIFLFSPFISYILTKYNGSHGITPPTPESEIKLLEKYAPGVKLSVIQKLVSTFTTLRGLVEKGLLSYPYSTRYSSYFTNKY